MNLNRMFILVAGFMVMLSALLTAFVNINFVYLTLFIGFMAFQSGITGVCPGKMLLKTLFFKNKKGNG